MTKAEQDAFDKNWQDQSKKLASTLAAAWVAAKAKPKQGEEGFSCAKIDSAGKVMGGDKSLCTGPNQCCGITKPEFGKLIEANWVMHVCRTVDAGATTNKFKR